MSDLETNKKIVLDALTGVMMRRDPSVVTKHFVENYAQHNPAIPDGRDAIIALIPALAANLEYRPGMVVAEGDLVMVHGRYVGWGPKPMVAVDIFRLVDGRIVEHWDVLQEEVPAALTKSGRSMF